MPSHTIQNFEYDPENKSMKLSKINLDGTDHSSENLKQKNDWKKIEGTSSKNGEVEYKKS